ncbi:serine hydrolase domain-containing protein [Agromyces kandeliae]|uniref:Serine hydrolase n=1 Tax=Agromyces kandeliae TaxID=2666141 RepID=A0A6L5R144_9MICO|nr:serine hydrolase domain-containing protein [Agromyces kandeliae]MRX43723.1 serine hydrolase [Agromyces kandeliae]
MASAVVVAMFAACTSPDRPAADFDQVEGAFAPEVVEQLDATLAEAVRLSGSSGAVAGVWAPWAGSWTVGTGTVDLTDGADRVTSATRFQLADGTGELTCAVMLRLVDAGVVELDDRVSEMVNGIPGLEGITLEQLCRNRSGIADYYGPLRAHFVKNPERIWPANELLASGLAAGRKGDPGTTWVESRTGILLLTAALEERTGRSWSDLAEQYVLDPLELEGTDLPAASDTSYADALGGYAATYADGKPACDAIVDVSKRSSSIGGTASGARTTLTDAKAISESFATGAMFQEATARDVWTLTPFGGDAPGWQAQGIGAQQFGPLRGVAGESIGALSAMFTDPETGLTVVLALNNSTGGETLVREAAFALASIASKASPAEGRDRPLVELPWSLEQATQRMTDAAPCPLPADAEG